MWLSSCSPTDRHLWRSQTQTGATQTPLWTNVSHRILLENGKNTTKTTLTPRRSRLLLTNTYTWTGDQQNTIYTQTHIHSSVTRIIIKIINNYMDTIYLVILIKSHDPKTMVTNLKCIYEFRQLYFFIEYLISVSNPSKIMKLNSTFVFWKAWNTNLNIFHQYWIICTELQAQMNVIYQVLTQMCYFSTGFNMQPHN